MVLDYDGTLVDLRHRFSGPEPYVVAELVRLLESGAWLGVATGRGGSVRRDLQKALRPDLWARVMVGYYNGADIAMLGDDGSPDRDGPIAPPLLTMAEALAAQPELAESATEEVRPRQITLQARRAVPELRLWDLANQVILAEGREDVVVIRSSHSIDIVQRCVSKREVVSRLRAASGGGDFLAIGDRGRWPGNDYDLLRSPFALSVDEVSVDPHTGWHLGPVGQRGVEVTPSATSERCRPPPRGCTSARRLSNELSARIVRCSQFAYHEIQDLNLPGPAARSSSHGPPNSVPFPQEHAQFGRRRMTDDHRPRAFGAGLLALDIVVSADLEMPMRAYAGGTCGNVLAELAYLGWEAFPVARLSDDPAAQRVPARSEAVGRTAGLRCLRPTRRHADHRPADPPWP